MAKTEDKVLYTPDDCHALEKDGQGRCLFFFAYAEGPKRDQDVPSYEIDGARRAGPGQPLRLNGGSGLCIKVVGPRFYWDAVVTRRHEDGTADLDIRHPRNGVLLQYHRVRHSTKKEANTWHLVGE